MWPFSKNGRSVKCEDKSEDVLTEINEVRATFINTREDLKRKAHRIKRLINILEEGSEDKSE